MIALTFNVIIPPADLSGVFTLHGIHYEKQSRSPGLALPGELGGPAAASSLAVLACVECCRRIPAACVGTARRALRAMFRKTRLKLNVQVAWCAARLFLRTTRALCQDAAFIVNPSKRLNLRMRRSKSRLCRHQLAWPLQSPSLENLRLPHCLRQQIPRQIRLQPCGSA